MKRWLAAAIVASMLAMPLASGATWERSGYDPGRTGAIPFEGPQTNDTAFQIELPGTPWGDPVIVDGFVYVVTQDFRDAFEGDTEGLDQNALWRIELATGDVERVMDAPERGGGGDTVEMILPDVLLAEEGNDLVAREIPSGEERWRATVRADDPAVQFRFYGDSAVRVGDTVYIEFSTKRGACVDAPSVGPVCPQEFQEIGGVMAVDLDTGQIIWGTDRVDWIRHVGGDKRKVHTSGFSLATDENQIYAYTWAVYSEFPTALEYELWALDATSGEAQWTRNDSTREGDDGAGVDGVGVVCCGNPVVTPSRLFLRLDAFQAFNKGDGAELWTSEAGRADQTQFQGSKGAGARGDALITTSTQSVYRLDRSTGGVDWLKTNEDPDKVHGTSPVTIDEETVYVDTSLREECFHAMGMDARDLETGELVWEWSHQPTIGEPCGSSSGPADPAFASGLLVYPIKDGTVAVIGETEASLGEPDVPDAMYPGVGNETTIDASGAEPGAFGNATRYMVDWGDGTISGWQEAPVFTHAYNESGTYEAQVYVGNEANQTSSTFVAMNVGEEAPTEPNWLAKRFEPENQDMTFGVLGLAVALGGGAIGVARRKRKQSILQEELETLEEGFERTQGNPGECEAFLDTRKARAQSLLLDGDLDEEQFGVLERRVDELHGELRTSVLDARFEFLPHGMVQSLKKMLADGRISTWEREAIADLLDREEALTDAQKEKVGSQLDRWFAEDAGGGEP